MIGCGGNGASTGSSTGDSSPLAEITATSTVPLATGAYKLRQANGWVGKDFNVNVINVFTGEAGVKQAIIETTEPQGPGTSGSLLHLNNGAAGILGFGSYGDSHHAIVTDLQDIIEEIKGTRSPTLPLAVKPMAERYVPGEVMSSGSAWTRAAKAAGKTLLPINTNTPPAQTRGGGEFTPTELTQGGGIAVLWSPYVYAGGQLSFRIDGMLRGGGSTWAAFGHGIMEEPTDGLNLPVVGAFAWRTDDGSFNFNIEPGIQYPTGMVTRSLNYSTLVEAAQPETLRSTVSIGTWSDSRLLALESKASYEGGLGNYVNMYMLAKQGLPGLVKNMSGDFALNVHLVIPSKGMTTDVTTTIPVMNGSSALGALNMWLGQVTYDHFSTGNSISGNPTLDISIAP
ncbi:hypothetical protein BH11PAT4_BH11PAT4_6570 [soil metagenome]